MALPVNGSTHLIPALLLIYRPKKDERLSWPSWLTCSGWFTHISGHPSAAGRAQDRDSSPVRDRRSTTVLRHQLYLKNYGSFMYEKPLSSDRGFAKCIRPLSGKSRSTYRRGRRRRRQADRSSPLSKVVLGKSKLRRCSRDAPRRRSGVPPSSHVY